VASFVDSIPLGVVRGRVEEMSLDFNPFSEYTRVEALQFSVRQ